MAPRLKTLSDRDVVAALRHFGFEVVSSRGSHTKLRREGPGGLRQTMTVPVHKDLARGTLLAIYRQALRYTTDAEIRPRFFTRE